MRGARFGKLSFITKNFWPPRPGCRHWPECRGTKYERQEPHGRKNKCGPGQPPKPHCSWSFLSHLPPLDGGRNFEPYSAPMERRICPKRPQNRDPAITKLLSSAVASGPFLLNERDGGGGRNARTTSTRLRAFLECSPAI